MKAFQTKYSTIYLQNKRLDYFQNILILGSADRDKPSVKLETFCGCKLCLSLWKETYTYTYMSLIKGKLLVRHGVVLLVSVFPLYEI